MTDAGIRPHGYRLPEAAHIGLVRLQVSDLARSLEYYTTLLGFRVLSRANATAVLGPHGEAPVPLVELDERRGVRPVPRRGLLGLYHFAILLPDHAALGRFVAHLAKAGAYAGSADHAVSQVVYLSDPDGLGIEVYADRPRSQWRTNGREIAITTEPLDLRRLVKAAAGEPWLGMPAGAVIGHVHFHVGAIREAEAFYHSALGFDKTAWTYPGALFLSAGGYHHHVGTNIWAAGSPAATDADARLLEWELVLPSNRDVVAAGANAAAAGYQIEEAGHDRLITDPWGITVRIVTGAKKEQIVTTPATTRKTTTYSIDKAHSEATFQVRHLLTKVRGRFSEFNGAIEYDEENLEQSSVNVTIQAASIDTNERDRDTHLRSADFFDVEKFSTLAFVSTRITRKGSERFDVIGDLTIHGVTRPATLDTTYLGKAKDPWGNERLAFEAETTINRKDFGLLWNAALETGGFLVGDEVRISLSVQALPKAS